MPENLHNDAGVNVVVIAHPDDESMFFAPLLTNLSTLSLQKAFQDQTHVICLTTGDYPPSVGATRIEELRAACIVYNILPNEVHILNLRSKGIFDSPDVAWPMAEVVAFLKKFLAAVIKSYYVPGIKHVRLYTFDEHGVSGHLNHVDTHKGVVALMREIEVPGKARYTLSGCDVTLTTLVTVPSVVKYNFCQPLHSALLTFYTCLLEPHRSITSYHAARSIAVSAMNKHASQNNWYRRLFVDLSAYSHTNIMEKWEDERYCRYRKSPPKNKYDFFKRQSDTVKAMLIMFTIYYFMLLIYSGVSNLVALVYRPIDGRESNLRPFPSNFFFCSGAVQFWSVAVFVLYAIEYTSWLGDALHTKNG
jgi:N-acetylglucosaminylphosphatidylinositol deacetylase